MIKMEDKYFGEGITRTEDDLVYQLTWREKTVFVYKLTND